MNYELKYLTLKREHRGWLSYVEEKRIRQLVDAIDWNFAMQRKIDKSMPLLIVLGVIGILSFFLMIGYSLKDSIEIIH